jgi:hypothetical protein
LEVPDRKANIGHWAESQKVLFAGTHLERLDFLLGRTNNWRHIFAAHEEDFVGFYHNQKCSHWRQGHGLIFSFGNREKLMVGVDLLLIEEIVDLQILPVLYKYWSDFISKISVCKSSKFAAAWGFSKSSLICIFFKFWGRGKQRTRFYR